MSQKFKAMYEAKLEFPEGWGVGGHRANPFLAGGGNEYFLEPHIVLPGTPNQFILVVS